MNCPPLVCPICNTPVDSHPANRCLDSWVAKEVMKLPDSLIDLPLYYSTSIHCAWMVLEEIKEEWEREIYSVGYNTGWEVTLELMIAYGPTYEGYGEEAPVAICIAALKATDALRKLKAKTWDEIFNWNKNRGLKDSYAKEIADKWKA